jgi:hypothetical protein
MVLGPAASAIEIELGAAVVRPVATCLQIGRPVSRLVYLSFRPPLPLTGCSIIPPTGKKGGVAAFQPASGNARSRIVQPASNPVRDFRDYLLPTPHSLLANRTRMGLMLLSSR